MTKDHVNKLTYAIIGGAIEVHRELGPGLLESIYEKCLIHELREKGLNLISQKKVPLIYKGIHLNSDLRFDLMVEDTVIVEIKAVEHLLPIHEAQLLTYLKLLKKPKGLLLNFNCLNIFKEGQKTMVTQYFSKLPSGY